MAVRRMPTPIQQSMMMQLVLSLMVVSFHWEKST
jgi:hypothetical protein